MQSFRIWFDALPTSGRVLVVLAIALVAHLLARLLSRFGERIARTQISPDTSRDAQARRQPKIATVTSLVVSGLTFIVYFVAVGFAIDELTPLTFTQYFGSAAILGLAVGFGTQGLVQDVVTGLTLIFSDALDIGDLAEVGGHVGRIEHMGLRFTTLTNFVGQTVQIPNRNIAVIGRFRTGYARAYLDVQIPDGVDEQTVAEAVGQIARAARAQFGGVIVSEPRVHPVQQAGEGGWRFVRCRFRIWPGQQGVIDTSVRPRVIAAMRTLDPAFADWMTTVTTRIPHAQPPSPPRRSGT